MCAEEKGTVPDNPVQGTVRSTPTGAFGGHVSAFAWLENIKTLNANPSVIIPTELNLRRLQSRIEFPYCLFSLYRKYSLI